MHPADHSPNAQHQVYAVDQSGQIGRAPTLGVLEFFPELIEATAISAVIGEPCKRECYTSIFFPRAHWSRD
ncbi:hypothetical protein D3876_13555 [Sphingomonas cavernae]|uniref:Uncharacterized protein n=1 Tax=Sphingomonas cavernae TaxID=2320861 RepID=A0A418WMC0_9SPHN|nr:hypothetical protein D3876_13555 [Sphingomonas cavernae]